MTQAQEKTPGCLRSRGSSWVWAAYLPVWQQSGGQLHPHSLHDSQPQVHSSQVWLMAISWEIVRPRPGTRRPTWRTCKSRR